MDKAPNADSAHSTVGEANPTRLSKVISRIGRLKGPIAAMAAVGGLVGGMAGYWNGWRALNSGIAEVSVSPAKPTGPVTPFSAADRRMTFAILPFQSPTGDADGARLALAAFEVTQSEQEGNILWARVVPRALIAQQTARPQTITQLGQALDTHFIFRGTITRSSNGYALELAVIDAATERVLDHQMVNFNIASGVQQMSDKAIRNMTHWLTYAALKQEVAIARSKTDAELDVRDLTFRAYVEQTSSETNDPAAVYATAMKSLRRAQELAPDDLLTLQVIAQLNLCECVRAWAADNQPIVEIGLAALDRGLTLRPDWPSMQGLRYWQFYKNRQYQEALLVADALLAKVPEEEGFLSDKVRVLLAMGEPKQALTAMTTAGVEVAQGPLAAAVYFANGDDAQAARLARKTLVQLTREQRADARTGDIALVLAAALARSGQLDEARGVFRDFQKVVPKSQTVSQIKEWLGPTGEADKNEALWTALQRAGVGS